MVEVRGVRTAKLAQLLEDRVKVATITRHACVPFKYTFGGGEVHLMGEPSRVLACPAEGALARSVDCFLRVAIVWLTVSLIAAVDVVAGAGAA